MKHFNMKSLVCLLLVLLLAATALTGCTNNTETTQAPKTEAPATEAPATEAPATEAPATEAPATEAPATDAPAEADREELGEGAKVFYLDVTTTDGATTSYAIHTDADTVGQALLDLKVIDGEEAGYGLYVTTVCGETLDWDADGMYWAFYVDGDYASTGVDATEITEGATYALAATKG